jgi:hypothetical protein
MAKLSDMVASATRAPYPLELDDGTTVSVAQPTLTKWAEACLKGDVFEFLAALDVSAEDVARVKAQLGEPLFGWSQAVVDALRTYYRLGN